MRLLWPPRDPNGSGGASSPCRIFPMGRTFVKQDDDDEEEDNNEDEDEDKKEEDNY